MNIYHIHTFEFKNPFVLRTETAPSPVLLEIAATVKQTMSLITDYAAKQTAFNTALGDGMLSLADSARGIAADVEGLNETIKNLQSDPADTDALAKLSTRGAALTERMGGLAAAFSSIDKLTPPTIPTGAPDTEMQPGAGTPVPETQPAVAA